MIGNNNLETLESIKNFVDSQIDCGKKRQNKYHEVDVKHYESGYCDGYIDAMFAVSELISRKISEEIEYRTQTLNAMYNDEFGEDGK